MKVYKQIVRGCIDCPNKETYGCNKFECRCKKVYSRKGNYRLVHEKDFAIKDSVGVIQGFGYPSWCPLEDAEE